MGGGGVTDKGTSPDWLRRNQADALFSQVCFLFVKPKETCSKQHFSFFFFFFFFLTVHRFSNSRPSFRPRQHSDARRLSQTVTDDQTENVRKRANDTETAETAAPSSPPRLGRRRLLVTKRQSVPSTTRRLSDDMQEHDAPVDISAAPTRLMNHAELLRARQRGCGWEAVNPDQTLTNGQS